MKSQSLPARVLATEIIGFSCVVLLAWANEACDLPHVFLGAPKTPLNWREALFESTGIIMLMAFTIARSARLIGQIRRLEGIMPLCSFCKRVKDGSEWREIDVYIKLKSEAQVSHGLCPDCAQKHYPDYYDPDHTPKAPKTGGG